MSTTQEKMTGVIASVTFHGQSKSGWKNYDAVFQDGRNAKIVIPPDCVLPNGEEYVPKTGDEPTFRKGRFNSWLLERESVGIPYEGSTNAGTGGGAKSSTGGGGGSSTREKYWEAKDAYDKEVKDPKITWLAIWRDVMNMYAANLPNLTKAPKTTTQMDQYIDDAYAKAEAVWTRKQKSFEKKD